MDILICCFFLFLLLSSYLLFIIYPVFIFSQGPVKKDFYLKGILIDSIYSKGIPFATISVYKLPDNVLIKRFASDSDGSFQVALKDTGNYQLNAQLIGFKQFNTEFSINTETSIIDLGRIILGEGAQELDEVSIIADKPLVKVDAEKISYSTESDPESKTSNVLDMMRKVPLLTVDGDDNIQLKGASNFKIFINGKPSTLLSSNPKDVLKNMPASSVKDIEVITSPGAKYDAEGIGGIINIITAKKNTDGYTCSINIGGGTNGNAFSSVYFSSSIGKFAFSTNLSASAYKPPRSRSERYMEYYNNGAFKYTNYNGYSKYSGMSPYGNGEFSYEIDTLNLISASFNFWYGHPKGNTETNVAVYDVNNQPVQSYIMQNLFDNEYGSPEGNIDYQHTFKRNKEQILTFSYKFNYSPDNNGGETEYLPILNYYPILKKSATEASTLEQTMQIDYVHPFSKKIALEIGSKYIHRKNSSFSEYFLFDYNQNQFVPDMESNEFDYTQQIMAAYSSLNLKFGKLGLKSGVRMERSITDGSISSQDTTFTNKSLEFVPTANLSYQLSPVQNLKMSYNMRIQRPDIWYLNPYIDKLDNKNISYGNPDLDPERYHSFELNYGRFGKKSNMNLSAFYSFSKNSIEEFSGVEDTVTYTTYYNMGKLWSAGGSVYGSLRFGTKFTINLNGSARYSEIESTIDDNLKNSGWGGNVSSSIQYSFKKGLRISAYGGAYFSGVGLQSKSSTYYYSSISLNQTFFKDKLTVSLSVRNPFWKEIEYTYETIDPNFHIKNIYIQPARNFGINLSFRFGEMKGEVKKTRRGINNDDVKAGESGSEGKSVE